MGIPVGDSVAFVTVEYGVVDSRMGAKEVGANEVWSFLMFLYAKREVELESRLQNVKMNRPAVYLSRNGDGQ